MAWKSDALPRRAASSESYVQVPAVTELRWSYVRFASVYRQFSTVDELFGEMQREMERRRAVGDPDQGQLFQPRTKNEAVED